MPKALVTAGGIFRAEQAPVVYGTPGIRKEEIERRQPWQPCTANLAVKRATHRGTEDVGESANTTCVCRAKHYIKTT